MLNDIKINIITPCSRPNNLKLLYNSINFDCIWYIVFDLEKSDYDSIISDEIFSFLKKDWIKTYFIKGGVSGNTQRNLALDQIKDGFVYVLDDDNLIHEDFYNTTLKILNKNQQIKGILYSQVLEDGSIRKVYDNRVMVNYIDQAQFLISYDIIRNIRYTQMYAADGIFIEYLYNLYKEFFFIYNETNITFYNKINTLKNE